MIIQIILIAIAAIAKAVADTIIFHEGGRLPKTDFWNNNVQGKMLPFTSYPMDGKHLANSVMIWSFLFAVCIDSDVPALIQFVVLGIVFVLIFNVFWNKILN